ncbi:hypothetical protein BKA56DRAFT_585653, partial [Ilyonectria sp. MPI-CAGE-AT-0026]
MKTLPTRAVAASWSWNSQWPWKTTILRVPIGFYHNKHKNWADQGRMVATTARRLPRAPRISQPRFRTARSPAEMQDAGFKVGNFRVDQHPESLKELRLQLRDIGSGHRILPASLQTE